MTVILESGYTLPGADMPLTHARIAHSLNWLSGGTVTASTTATDAFANGPTNTLTYERWTPTADPSTWEYDHGSSVECDYCCVGAHTLGTVGATLGVEYHNGTTWVSICSEAVTTDEPVMAIFEPITAQRWRLNISGGIPDIGVIKFGTALQMPRPVYGGHVPIFFARQTEMRSNISETGEDLGRTVQRRFRATSIDWQHITATWMRANWGVLQRAIESEPFFIAWRPGTFGDVALCQVDQVPIPQNMGVRDLMAVSMSMRARGYD